LSNLEILKTRILTLVAIHAALCTARAEWPQPLPERSPIVRTSGAFGVVLTSQASTTDTTHWVLTWYSPNGVKLLETAVSPFVANPMTVAAGLAVGWVSRVVIVNPRQLFVSYNAGNNYANLLYTINGPGTWEVTQYDDSLDSHSYLDPITETASASGMYRIDWKTRTISRIEFPPPPPTVVLTVESAGKPTGPWNAIESFEVPVAWTNTIYRLRIAR
jgi:hypothetical protein